jgi:uncharacterized repeat protein (TIGR01451 family)
MSRWSMPLVALLTLPVASMGQKAPYSGPAPLLYVRFTSPVAMQVRVYPGGPAGRTLVAPATVGLRPGYIYRVKLSNLPEHPREALYPTLEVRGTLRLPATMRAADYPVPIVLHKEDVEQALAGSLVTKVVYLESPERAIPVATQADQPLETDLRPGTDLVEEARALGRPLLILRLGGRSVSEEELTAQAVPGTVLLPGEKSLRPPAAPAYVPWASWPVYDPIAGPRPYTEECLRDGGDGGPRVGLDATGRLRGLDPADTAAVYTDSHGGRHLAVSNPVCICVPRFAVLRSLMSPIGYNVATALEDTRHAVGEFLVQARTPPLLAQQIEQLQAVRGQERPSATENRTGTLLIAKLQGNAFLIGRYQGQSVTGVCFHHVPPPDRPLVLSKSADKEAAVIGDVITFRLRYTNQGGQPISGIAISDSLTARLEYIPGTARSDHQAVFSMIENEVGSVVLHWEIGSPLPPGQSGEVTFQVRVR